MPAVVVEGIEKLYYLGKHNVVHALRGTDLTVGEGEFIAIMGPSGSGKSTLLNVIGCLSQVTAGHVFVGGQDVTKLKPSALDRIRARDVGFIFQNYSLIPTRTALQNVMLAAEYAGMPQGRAPRRARSRCSSGWDSATASITSRASSPAASSSGSRSRARS